MKHRKVLKLFLLLALVFTLSSSAYAVSEVSGTLSSGGVNNDGSLSGTVSSNSSGSSSGRRVNSGSSSSNQSGEVASSSTTSYMTPTSSGGSISSSGGSSVSTPDEVSVVDLGEGMDLSTDDSSDQIAQAFAPLEDTGIGIGSWLLILLLVLVLIAIVSYIYNRSLDDRTTRRLP